MQASAEGHEAIGDVMWKPGLIATMNHLRGEEDLRHASLQDFRGRRTRCRSDEKPWMPAFLILTNWPCWGEFSRG